MVDTLGLLLAVSVTAASVQDRDGAHPVVAAAMTKYPSIQRLFADSGYAGQCAQTVSQCHGIRVQVVRHPANRNVGRWIRPEQLDLFTVKADAQGFASLYWPSAGSSSARMLGTNVHDGWRCITIDWRRSLKLGSGSLRRDCCFAG